MRPVLNASGDFIPPSQPPHQKTLETVEH